MPTLTIAGADYLVDEDVARAISPFPSTAWQRSAPDKPPVLRLWSSREPFPAKLFPARRAHGLGKLVFYLHHGRLPATGELLRRLTGNPNDLRRESTRIGTRQEVGQAHATNLKPAQKKTAIPEGVHEVSPGRFVVYFRRRGTRKIVPCGAFRTQEQGDAALARMIVERRYRQEFPT